MSECPFSLFYNSLGYLDSVNCGDNGHTIAVFQQGNLHPDYAESEEAQMFLAWQAAHSAIAPLFNAGKIPPAPPLPPDWAGFRMQVTVHSAYLRIVSHSGTTQALNTALVGLLWRVGEDASLLAEVAQVWGAIAQIAIPTADEIAALNAIGLSCRMPFVLDSSGGMVSG